jgi:hypothetical protein
VGPLHLVVTCVKWIGRFRKRSRQLPAANVKRRTARIRSAVAPDSKSALAFGCSSRSTADRDRRADPGFQDQYSHCAEERPKTRLRSLIASLLCLSRSTFRVPRSTFHVPRSTFGVPRSTLCVLCCAFDVPRAAFPVPHFPLRVPRCAFGIQISGFRNSGFGFGSGCAS